MHDVAVIGAGPAGIAASIYLKRAGFDIILFEKSEIGGLLLNAYLVENYPGFSDGISGMKLCKLLEKHLEKWNIRPIMRAVKKIKIENNHFLLDTQKDKITCKVIVLATGTKPKELGIPVERDLIGKKVFYEIKDLLPILKPRNVCTIIGGGDASFDYALNLADKGVIAEIFFRSEKPNCLYLLEERAKNSSKINLHPSVKPYKIIKIQEKIETEFKCSKTNRGIKSVSDYVLIACGRKPNLELLSNNLKKSNIPGLFIAGDVKTGKFRQVGIAIGKGIYSAMSAENYLRGSV